MNKNRLVNHLRTIVERALLAFDRRGFLKWMPDKWYLKVLYLNITGKKLNLKTPSTYTEKLQWLKLYDRKPQYVQYVDKYNVRAYIKETIGEKHLIPLHSVFDSVEAIDWEGLPSKFVLKCTHGSGCNIICTKKHQLDRQVAQTKLKLWMKKNWFWGGREWPYKAVKPRIICEAFISDSNITPDDYKVLCFNGKAKLIEVHIDRYGEHTQDFYDINWQKTTISQGTATSDIVYQKPRQFEEMIQLSEQLAACMRHVRIDWFIVGNQLYFGEITFYDGSGFELFDEEEDNYLLGSWINLREG